MTRSEVQQMFVLSGEQTAPNLLAARYLKPEKVYILHTDFEKSQLMAERLALRLKEMQPELKQVASYDPGKVAHRVRTLLAGCSDPVVNITGGTKPMSIGALQAAALMGCPALYVRSQGGKTEMDWYKFDDNLNPQIEGTTPLQGTITLEDYLVSYFGLDYQFTGCGGKDIGLAFEQAVHRALLPAVNEIEMGWKHASEAVDVDAVIRCNNQIGIMEIKTGKKARSAEGIKQLAVAGGQRFFGTYTRRILVVNQDWASLKNLRALAEALNITLVELPGYAGEPDLIESHRQKLIDAVHQTVGMPLKA